MWFRLRCRRLAGGVVFGRRCAHRVVDVVVLSVVLLVVVKSVVVPARVHYSLVRLAVRNWHRHCCRRVGW